MTAHGLLVKPSLLIIIVLCLSMSLIALSGFADSSRRVSESRERTTFNFQAAFQTEEDPIYACCDKAFKGCGGDAGDEKGSFQILACQAIDYYGNNANSRAASEKLKAVQRCVDQACPYIPPGKNGGDKDDEEKEVNVIVGSYQCKSRPEWGDLQIKVDGKDFFDANAAEELEGRGIRKSVSLSKTLKISPGQHTFSVSSPDFPKTKIQTVQLFKDYLNDRPKELIGEYSADDSGKVTADLVKNLWEKREKDSYLLLHITLLWNCDVPNEEPKEYGKFTVIDVGIGVTVSTPETRLLFGRGDRSFVDAKKGDVYRIGDKLTGGTNILTGQYGTMTLESEYGHKIEIDKNAEVSVYNLTTPGGRRELRVNMPKRGKVTISYPNASAEDDVGQTTVETGTATVSNTKTIYSVSYDETTKMTKVSVAEGEVRVFPTNESLQPVTLTANQQVEVTESSVSPVAAITPETGGGGNAGKIILYVGIGLLSLFLLTVMFLFFRRQYRTMPAFYSARQNRLESMTPQQTTVPVGATLWRCPNPQCGKEIPAAEKFCAHCGTSLNA